MKRRQNGVTLIEVMIVVLISAILIAAAIPSFTVWIQNTQIRTASESIVNALQTARNEAIRRNTCVQVEMLDKPLSSWEVRPCNYKTGDPVIIGRAHSEGSGNATVELGPTGATIASFNALGRIVSPNPSDGTTSLVTVDVRNITLQADDERRLRIEVPTGGAVRMCDPKVATTTDPRYCQIPL